MKWGKCAVLLLVTAVPMVGFAQQGNPAVSGQGKWWSESGSMPSAAAEAEVARATDATEARTEQAATAPAGNMVTSVPAVASTGSWHAQDFDCMEVHRFATVTGFIENKKDARAATIPSEKLSAIQSLIAGYIPEKLPQFKSTIAESGAPSCPDPGRALVLDGRITDFKKGNQALRYFVGFGAGAQKFSVLARITRKSDGALVSEGEITDHKVGGWIGGQADKGQDDFAEKVVDFLRKSLMGKN